MHEMIYSHFLCSTSLDGFEQVTVDGTSPHESFDALHDLIRRETGAAIAGVLAEPLISYGNGEAAMSISWYAAYEGNALPLTSLDPVRREAAEALLRARIDAIKTVIARIGDAQVLAAALYFPSPSDVYVVGREPVISNWGVVPEGAMESDTRRRAVFAAGLGALGVTLAAPPLAAEAFAAWRNSLETSNPEASFASGAQQATAGAEAAETMTETTTDTAKMAAQTPPSAILTGHIPIYPIYRRAWFPALVACLIAALILVILLIPGVLLYPERARVAVIEDQTNVLRGGNDALEERLVRLRQAHNDGVCMADGTFGTPATPLLPPGAIVDESLTPQ